MNFNRALFGYPEEEVSLYLERLKSTQGAEMLELECRIESIQDEINNLNQQVEPLRTNEGLRREEFKEISQKISDLYLHSILPSYEMDRRLNDEEANKIQAIQKKSQELDRVRETMDQLCKEIEKLTQGFKSVMEGRTNG